MVSGLVKVEKKSTAPEGGRSRKPWRQYKGWLLLFLAVGVAVTAGIALVGDLKELFLAGGMDYRYLPLLLLLAPLNYCLRYVKWRYFLGKLGVFIPERENLIIFVAGLSMTLTPGKAGELLKCYLLREGWNIPVTTTAPVVVAERLTDGISMILLASVGAVYYSYGGAVLAATTGAVGLFVLLLQNPGLTLGLLQRVERIPLVGRLVPPLAEIQACFHRLLKPQSLLVAVLLGLISWAFEGLVLYLGVLALGARLSLLQALFIVSFSAIVGALSFLPGGLVAVEGTILGLLYLAGLNPAVAGAATIITRFSTLWLGVALGVMGLFLAERIIYRNGTERE
jgi:uncharacterized protein (TIRG00374 family)